MTQIVDNFGMSGKKFLDARQKWASLTELQANEDILMPNGFIVHCEYEDNWYVLHTTDPEDPSTYEWKPFGSIQVEELPEITEDNKDRYLGVVYQYIGETDENYVHGRFYEGKEVEDIVEVTDESSPAFDVSFTDKTKVVEEVGYGEATFTYNKDDDKWECDGTQYDLADIGMEITIFTELVGGETFTVTSVEGGYKWVFTATDPLIQFGGIDNAVPEATEENEGQIIQYTGKTAGTFTNGWFYKSGMTTYTAYTSTETDDKVVYGVDNGTLLYYYDEASDKFSRAPRWVWDEKHQRWDDKEGEFESFTKDNADPEKNIERRAWKQIDVQPSAEEKAAAFKEDMVVTVGAGNLVEGEVVTKDTTFEATFRKMLSPVTTPKFAFTTDSTTTLLAKGDEVEAPTLTVKFEDVGHNDECKLVITKDGESVMEVDVTGSTEDVVYEETANITENTTYKVTITAKDEDATQVVVKSKSVVYKFIDPEYYGIVTTAKPDADAIKALTKRVAEKIEFTYNAITMKNKRICYAFPTDLGAVEKVVDGNKLNITSSFTVTTVDVDGVDYTVYAFTDTATLDAGEVVFIEPKEVVIDVANAVVSQNADGNYDIDIGDEEIDGIFDSTATKLEAKNSEDLAKRV